MVLRESVIALARPIDRARDRRAGALGGAALRVDKRSRCRPVSGTGRSGSRDQAFFKNTIGRADKSLV